MGVNSILVGVSYREIGPIDSTKIVAVQRVIDRLLPRRRYDFNLLLVEDDIR